MSKFKDHQLPLKMSGDQSPEGDSDVGVVVSTSKPAVAPPPMFQVLMLNDDFTPMEFVVDVLQRFFNMNREKATHVMIQVHTKGQASCGVFTRDVAETKAAQVIRYAREKNHPLLCRVEKV